MLLNILAERSLNNLSQYTIFPLIICNFEQSILNHMNKSIYRDLSLPIFVCYPSLINDFKELDLRAEDKEDSNILLSNKKYIKYMIYK